MTIWEMSSTLVRSTRSATAPATRARPKNGRVVEALMRPTQVADPVSSSISQAPAEACRKVPRFEKRDAPHNARKCNKPKRRHGGSHGEGV